MKKDVAIGFVVALSIGILVGYFALPLLFPSEAATEERQKYFTAQNLDNVYSVTQWTDIPKLNITFTTLQNDDITFYYTSIFRVDREPSDTNISSFNFVFKIDGINCEVAGQYNFQIESNSTNILSYPITYRLIRTGMSAGTHNVSVTFSVSSPSFNQKWASLNVLSVQIA